jgi:hypothetical protein
LDYTFSMDAAMTNGALTCSKCITKTVTYKDTCAYCEISVVASGSGGHGIPNTTSAGGKLVVIYQDSGSTTMQYLTITPGQTQVLKKTATIVSVINYGNVSATYSCGTLPASDTVQCYELSWAVGTSGPTPVLSGDVVEYIEILGVQYPVSVAAGDVVGFTNFLPTFLPIQLGLMANVAVGSSNAAAIAGVKFFFQTTSTIASSMEAYVGNPGNANGAGAGYDGGLYVRPFVVDSSNCPAASSSSSGSGSGN